MNAILTVEIVTPSGDKFNSSLELPVNRIKNDEPFLLLAGHIRQFIEETEDNN